mgnify:FL=1|tara:strand:- start:22 stop:294 length:273 start_codon:yes stop_codon:yes gene_type:complete
MKITKTSMISGKTNSMEIDVSVDQYQSWIDGENIQVAMPHLSADEREFIKTGMTPSEWEELFGEEEEEDDGQPSWEQEWEDFGEVYSDEY